MNCQRKILLSIFLFVSAVMTFQNAPSEILHVPGQYTTIKSGISAAGPGDTVMVSAGTYYGFGNRDIDFGKKKIVLRSMKGAILTVINCEGTKMDPHRGFRAHQGEDSLTVIEGFTVINGYAPPDPLSGDLYGGGILCSRGSSPTIKDCIFYNNYAQTGGGGMCCIDSSSPTVIGCTFIDNSAVGDTLTSFAIR